MKTLINAIIVTVLAIVCTIPFVAQQSPATPAPQFATKAEVAAINQRIAVIDSESKELKSGMESIKEKLDRMFSKKSAEDETAQSHEESNARELEDMQAKANAAIDSFTKRSEAMVDECKQHIDSLIPKGDEHSILTDEQQREKFEADYSAVAKIVFEPKSCPLPEVNQADIDKVWKAIDELKPAKVAKPVKSKQAGWRGTVDDAATRYVVFLCTTNLCSEPGQPCSNYKANVLSSGKFSDGLADRNATSLVLNLDDDADAGSHFEVHRTPYIVVWDKSQSKWHGMLADGNDSPGQALWRVDQCLASLNSK